MKACGFAQGATGVLLIIGFSFAGCGQSKPAEAPGGSGDAPTSPSEPSAEGTTDPSDETTDPGGSSEGTGSESGEGDSETRTTELIQKTIVDQRKPFRDCYEKAKKDLKTLQGTMTLKFTLDPEGKVKTAELNQERSDLKSPTVVDCSLAELKKLKFPPSSRGMETTVNYPFNFKP